MIYSIVYISASKDLLDDWLLKTVIEQSRENNSKKDITGVLIFCNGSIIQVLEGEREAVDSLFTKIKKDRRHSQVILLYQGMADHRSFEKWAMGYTSAEKRNMDELKDQLSFVSNPYVQSSSESKVISLVQTFFKNNHRN
jgi:hypothetical protein